MVTHPVTNIQMLLNFKKEIVESVLKAHQKMVEEDKNRTNPMYRSREWNRNERELEKSKKKFNWWNSEKSKIKYKSVLFVTLTQMKE